MKLTAGVSLRDVKQRIGVGEDEELRESQKRRAYLQKFARIITTERPSLRFAPDFPTAAVNQEQDNPVILMTTREFNQPVTSLSCRVFDMMMQEALTVHELGHILYTDHDSFKNCLSSIDLEYKSMFKATWNTLEDGAIEKQLRDRFSVEDELYVLNANLMTKDEFGHEIDEDMQRFSLFQSVKLGLSDMAVYDTGEFQNLLDPGYDEMQLASGMDREILKNLVPAMQDVAKDVLTEPNGEARNDRIYEFWINDLKPAIDQADVSGQSESNLSNLIGDDGSIGDNGGSSGQQDQDVSAQPVSGKPDDSDNDLGEAIEEASALGYDDVAEQVEAQVEVAGGTASEEQEEMAEEIETSSAGDDGEDGEDGGEEGEDGAGGSSIDESNVEEERQGALAAEAQEIDGGEELLDEAEEFLAVIEDANEDDSGGSGASGGFQGLSMDIPEGDDYSEDRWNQAQRESKKLKRVLRNRLREERRTKTRRNQRRGSFDRRNIINAARGSPRVFERDKESNEKEYDCIIVVDRSGSMDGGEIRQAEIAASALSGALHDIGVDVSVMDMYQNEARLALAFGQDPETNRENLANGLANGGTPLSRVIHLARRRVESEDSHPFMIVITDGRPNDRDTYLNELDKCTFPVLGVIVTSENAVQNGRHDQDEQYYHRQVCVTDGSEIGTSLLNLAQEVMF